jgi:lipoprotein-anchoring transpeptidase ErfK/SrfK
MTGLQLAHDPFVLRAHLRSTTVELQRDGHLLETWTAATGAAATPTPTGRTFVLASVIDPHQTFSPLILPLGAHSPALDSYAGGPATVALHTWPTSEVFGQQISHGCLRVPADAMQILRTVPLGTLVIIDQS